MSMTLISSVTVTVNNAIASIDFFNIPQTGKDLLIVFSGRSDAANTAIELTLNGTAFNTNWTRRHLNATGSSVQTGSGTNSSFSDSVTELNFATSAFSNGEYYISNYTQAVAKSVSVNTVTEQNATNPASQRIIAALWNNTAAITSLDLNPTGNFVIGSTVSLYIIS